MGLIGDRPKNIWARLAQKPGGCAARAAIERHLKRFSRFGSKKPAVFSGAFSIFFSRDKPRKNGNSCPGAHYGIWPGRRRAACSCGDFLCFLLLLPLPKTQDPTSTFHKENGKIYPNGSTGRSCAAGVQANCVIEIWNCARNCEGDNERMHRDQNFVKFDPECGVVDILDIALVRVRSSYIGTYDGRADPRKRCVAE